MNKQVLEYTSGLLLGFLVLLVWQMPGTHTRIIACDVGQGDSILIIKGSNQVLIDGGPSGERVLSCLERYVPFWDRNIELIVLTNTDFDHMNGLSSVVNRYSLTKFVTADGVHESDALERLVSVLSKLSVSVDSVEQGDTITVGVRDTLTFRVLWPPEVDDKYLAVFSNQIDNAERKQILGASAKRGDLNERSVVLLLTDNGYRAMFTGDSGFQAEKELLTTGLLSKIDYLKVGHHGSKYASSLDFLEKIRPSIAVISVGEKNRYGHPTNETLERLSKIGAEVRRTDEEGDVLVELK